MIEMRPRRSLVFQFWLRLSAVTVSFTLLALGIYIWLEIRDTIDEAHDRATERALAVATAATRFQESGTPPSAQEAALGRALHVVAIQFIEPSGAVTHTYGDPGV